MRTFEYLTEPGLAEIYWPMVLAGLAIAISCATLSVIVVLKRLVFIGQGVSHAAFGGVGVAYVLGITGVGSLSQELSLAGIVLLFCIASALTIAHFGREDSVNGGRGSRADSVIGIVLVGAMALGFLLFDVAGQSAAAAGRVSPPGVETVLFGSFTSVSRDTAVLAWVVAVVVVGTYWLLRRRIVFWAFDEPAGEAFGLRTRLLGALVMVLLALAIVTTMRLAGVILATALLVLPGAIALQLSRRSTRVFVLAQVAAVLGVMGGLVLSFEADLQQGPSVVGVLLVLLVGASMVRQILSQRQIGG